MERFPLYTGITLWHEIDENNACDAKLFKYPQDKAWLLKHASLVPFSELDNVSKRVNEIRRKKGNEDVEDLKETDRRIVRHFGMFHNILHKK